MTPDLEYWLVQSPWYIASAAVFPILVCIAFLLCVIAAGMVHDGVIERKGAGR
jgi:hypothetical protein